MFSLEGRNAWITGAAYGIGYMQGPAERTRTHTRIAESRRIRARKEAKERKARMAEQQPDQLN